MGPLYFFNSAYWRGRFRDVLMKKNIIYTSLPRDEGGVTQDGTPRRRHRAIVNATMASVLLALFILVAWSAL
jgi:hypothetical protein